MLSLAPYWTHGVNLEHDTCFHLSRIEGLAQSFKDGIYMPRIYPYKNNNFGYASPLFYCDFFFLIIPALLYNAGLSGAQLSILTFALQLFFGLVYGKTNNEALAGSSPQCIWLHFFMFFHSIDSLIFMFAEL